MDMKSCTLSSDDSRRFYTTSIIYNLDQPCYSRHCKERSEPQAQNKMNFNFTSRYLHIEKNIISLLGSREYLYACLQIGGSGSCYTMIRKQ